MPRKTTQRPDLFSELDSRQFEDLVRQLAPRVYPFRKPLTEVGRLGSDEGRDAAATEVLKKGRKTIERPWLLQMKRYQRITPKQLEAIVEAAVPDPTNPPHGLLVATSADVSPLARKRYAAAASARGVTDSVIWDRSQLVDMLLDPGNHDLNRL